MVSAICKACGKEMKARGGGPIEYFPFCLLRRSDGRGYADARAARPERTFERSFQLADHVVVKGARLENGLLHVDLEREIPEAMKPRAIPIASSGKVLQVKPTKVAA
jgi:hypothetical protein